MPTRQSRARILSASLRTRNLARGAARGTFSGGGRWPPDRLFQGFEIRDDVLALVVLLQAGEGHDRPRHLGLGALQIFVEGLRRPGEAGRLVGLRLAESVDRAGLAADLVFRRRAATLRGVRGRSVEPPAHPR